MHVLGLQLVDLDLQLIDVVLNCSFVFVVGLQRGENDGTFFLRVVAFVRELRSLLRSWLVWTWSSLLARRAGEDS